MMRIALPFLAAGAIILSWQAIAEAQPNSTQLGKPGIAWYCRWDTALSEAKRSQRPILFVAAAAQCNAVPGVF